jgi:HlyD family secretion protein
MTANIVIYTREEDHALLISARALKFKRDASLARQYRIIALNTDSASAGSASMHHRSGHGLQRDPAIKKRNDTAVVVTPKWATVWTLAGDSLIQRELLTGLNDDAHVEVLRGLSPDDEVVDAIRNPAYGTPAASGPARSPFMPQRRRSNNNAGRPGQQAR